MFENCYELTSLDISNFDTSKLFIMNYMFNNCHKLSYINLSNVKLLSAYNAEYFLANCTNLEFIDLTNFRESPNLIGDNIFEGSSDNFSYCINNIDENPIIMGSINNKYCTINDCSNIWKVKQKKNYYRKK
jgi:surface protein